MVNVSIEGHKRILLSPLNWGLGHATRLIPVIKQLNKDGHQCFIAGASPSIDVLEKAFPEIPCFELPGYNAYFSSSFLRHFIFLLEGIRFILDFQKEQQALNSLIEKLSIDLIISDNRYGLYSKKVRSVIITHQTSPLGSICLNWFRPFTTKVIHHWLNRFDECWIPDDMNYLSGCLSQHLPKIKVKRIGLLSRLSDVTPLGPINIPQVDILVILSGPEPQRSQLEQLLIEHLQHLPYKSLILQASPAEIIHIHPHPNLSLMSHCSDGILKQLLLQSKYIICRSGYSTLMDLYVCNRTALLIPTPGQYEQIYLADHMVDNFNFLSLPQKRINTENIQNSINLLTPFN
jgi:hypothetical protein